ncbi:MAG: hypothetical protein P8Y71_21915 [Pseudolabrys sp.]
MNCNTFPFCRTPATGAQLPARRKNYFSTGAAKRMMFHLVAGIIKRHREVPARPCRCPGILADVSRTKYVFEYVKI